MKKVFIAVLLAATFAFAADQAPNKTPRASEFPFTFGPMGISTLMKTAGISPAQMSQIEAVMNDSRDALKAQLEEVDKHEGDLQSILAQPQFDQVAAERAVNAVIEARDRLSRTQTMMMVKMRAQLSQEQWQKMADKTNTQMRINLNEQSAASTIRTVNSCVVTFFSTYKKGYPDGLNRLSTPPVGQPMDENHADVCGPRLSGLEPGGTNLTFTSNGYKYVYTPGPGGYGNIKSFTVSAQPIEFNVTGTRSFYLDETGVTRATNANRAAKSTDYISY